MPRAKKNKDIKQTEQVMGAEGQAEATGPRGEGAADEQKENELRAEAAGALPVTKEEMARIPLPCALTFEDLQKLAQELADAISLKADEEAEFNGVRAEYKARIANADKIIQTAASKIHKRTEERFVDCRIVFNYETGRKSCLRTDTGEMVWERQLTREEAQMDLFPQEGAEDETKPIDYLELMEGAKNHGEAMEVMKKAQSELIEIEKSLGLIPTIGDHQVEMADYCGIEALADQALIDAISERIAEVDRAAGERARVLIHGAGRAWDLYRERQHLWSGEDSGPEGNGNEKEFMVPSPPPGQNVTVLFNV